jgi:hypothetical protein
MDDRFKPESVIGMGQNMHPALPGDIYSATLTIPGFRLAKNRNL